MKEPAPRVCSGYGALRLPTYGVGDDTWLEAEEFSYPNGAKRRRCRARHTETRQLVLVKVGIPDTFFSIPAAGGGYVMVEEGVFMFHPPKTKTKTKEKP